MEKKKNPLRNTESMWCMWEFNFVGIERTDGNLPSLLLFFQLAGLMPVLFEVSVFHRLSGMVIRFALVIALLWIGRVALQKANSRRAAVGLASWFSARCGTAELLIATRFIVHILLWTRLCCTYIVVFAKNTHNSSMLQPCSDFF